MADRAPSPPQSPHPAVLSYGVTPAPRKRPIPIWFVFFVPLGFSVGGAIALLQISLYYRVPITLDLLWAIFCWTFLLDLSIVVVFLRLLLALRRRLSALSNSALTAAKWWLCFAIGLASGLFRWGLPAFINRLAFKGDLQLMWLFIVPVVVAFAAGIFLV